MYIYYIIIRSDLGTSPESSITTIKEISNFLHYLCRHVDMFFVTDVTLMCINVLLEHEILNLLLCDFCPLIINIVDRNSCLFCQKAIEITMPIGRHINGCFVLGECHAPFMLKKHCISSCCDTTFHNKVPLLSFCSSAFHQILHWTFLPSSKFLALSE